MLGQALVGGGADRGRQTAPIHSLHGYFLLAGDPEREIIYDVERIRDGGSFTTRRVTRHPARPRHLLDERLVPQAEEGYDHQSAMPDVPPPESAAERQGADERHAMANLPENMRAYWRREHPIDVRIVDASRYASREPRPATQSIWLKANGPLPDGPYIHQAVLAYASDFTLLDTALVAHGKLLFDSDIQLASLDHAMWFHRPFRADGWLLYVQDSPSGLRRPRLLPRRYLRPPGPTGGLDGPGRPDAPHATPHSCSNSGQTFRIAQFSCLFCRLRTLRTPSES